MSTNPQPNLDLEAFIKESNAERAARPNPLQQPRPNPLLRDQPSDTPTTADLIQRLISEAKENDTK